MVKPTKMRHPVIRLGLAVSCIVLRRSRAYMLAGLAAVALIAGGGAPYALASHGGPVKPLMSCKQQYAAWTSGPARVAGQRLRNDMIAHQSAANSQNISQMVFALRTLGSDASALQRYPIPACADPAGYWAQSLSYLKAAGDNAVRATSVAAVIRGAEGPLQQVRSLWIKLRTELARTVGVKG